MENYVRAPLREVDAASGQLQSIDLEQTTTARQIRLGDNQFTIPRAGPQSEVTSEGELPL